MPQTLTERVTELERELAVANQRLDNDQEKLHDLRQDVTRLTDGLAAVRTDIAVLQQGLAEVVKRLDERDRIRWAVLALFIGCVLTFGANLLLAFLKR